MKKIIYIVIALVVLVGGYLMLGKKSAVEETGPIKIGAILNLTGTFANQGENSQKGIKMAIEEINANGGVLSRKLETNIQDNLGDSPSGAISAMHSLSAQNIRLIIGPNLTPSANVIAPLTEKENVVMIAPSVGSEKFAELSPRTFNVFPPNKFDSYSLAEYLYNEKGFRKIAIFGSQQEWEHDQAMFVQKRFEELGGKVTSVQLPTVDNQDLRSESLKIKNENPEAVVFTNYGETGIAAKRLKELKVSVPFYSVLLFEPKIAEASGALEGAVFVSTDTNDDNFTSKFKTKYGVAPGFPASQAYDAVYLIAKAITDSKSSDPASVTKALSKITKFSGASGEFTFDRDGNAHKKANFYVVKNSKAVPYLK
jgi:branched-chain amino acid transport system substrate-binding protein